MSLSVFNPFLCCLSPFHLPYVAVSRPCCALVFTLIEPYSSYLPHPLCWLPCYSGQSTAYLLESLEQNKIKIFQKS